MTDRNFMVKEAAVAYGKNALTPLELVYSKNKFDSTLQRLTIIKSVRSGVTQAQFKLFLKEFGFSMKEMTEILPASYSSLSKLSIYDKDTSERIIELSMLFKLGIEVFGSITKFTTWLRNSSNHLGGTTPFSLLDTSIGFSLVSEELRRIEYSFVA
ncbi:MAG: antitoxin Xre/MbcA/ParS toxin-binding domain-containing protein [Flavobacteriales bacterium]